MIPKTSSRSTGRIRLTMAAAYQPDAASKLPARPGGEGQEAGSTPTRKVVVVVHQVEHTQGMARGAGHIPEDHGLAGPVHGDRTRQSPERRHVGDDHGALVCGWPPRGRARRRQPSLGVPQAARRPPRPRH